MRLLTRSGLVLATVLAVAALPTAAPGAPSGASAPHAIAANSTTYQDSTGESAGAPDITTLTVSNTDSGALTFRVNIPNRPTLDQGTLFDLYVDSDNRPGTGSPDLAGVDYVIQLARGEVNLYRWDGTDFTRRFGDPSAVTLSFSYQGGLTIRISAAELGNTKRLRFFVEVATGCTVDPVTGAIDCTNALGDFAPGGGAGLFAYEVKTAPARLVVKRVNTGRATAGKPFTVSMVAARSDTNAVVRNGRVTCVARVGNARLRARVQAVVGGAATCTWTLPPNSKGKRIRGSVSLVFEGLRASQSFSTRIG